MDPGPRDADGAVSHRARVRRSRTRLLTAVAVAAATVGVPAPAVAQEEGAEQPVTLEVEEGTGVLRVRLGSILEDGGLQRALRSGLPLRIRVQVELWRDRFFDSQKGRADWRATVVYDPLARNYRVETSADRRVRAVSSLSEVGRILSLSFGVPLRPTEEGSYYYLGVLEVETLSLSDLEELQRWLGGDLAPAVAGEQEVEGAVERGVRRLVVRVLGLPARRYRVRTETFEVGGG